MAVPAEARLQTSDAQLRRIAGHAARLGGWTLDIEQQQLVWSDEVCVIHDLPPGYKPTLAEGLGYFPPEVRGEVIRCIEACAKDGTPYDLELPKYTATGRRIWVRSIGEAVRDQSGRIIHLQGAFQDISERKRIEQRVIEQAALLDKANDAITVSDMDWRITYWNKAAERLYGWTAAEVAGGHLHELLQVDTAVIAANMPSLRANGEWKGELKKTNRHASTLLIQASWTLLQDEQGHPKSILTIDTDITERRQVEEQFRQSQKMEAIGRLAGGVAHDFNNLLTVINGYSENLLELPSLQPQVRDSARIISEAGIRAAALTRQLLGFSRQSVLQPQILDLNAVVQDTGKLLHRLIGQDILFKAVLNPLISRVRVDPVQMDQVLMNLAINARDAMPQGGQLTIATDNVELDADFAARHAGCKPGPHVLLAMTDTGAGMTPAVVARIFEPFFTTKAVGKGSGLGLAMVFGIVQQSGGWIQVASEPGRGTTFRIYLPALVAPARVQPATVTKPNLAGTETILLVEDEENIRKLILASLQRQGYQVLTAVDGLDGLQAVRAYAGTVDLVLTDVTMPNLNGPGMVKALKAQFPHLKVLFMSGYLDVASLRHGLLTATAAFIQKPFTLSALVMQVRQVLDT